MLAKITEGIPDALKQLKGQAFLAEYKYDGQRAQIHLLQDRSVKVFSRNCEDKTAAFPDVVEVIQTSATGAAFARQNIAKGLGHAPIAGKILSARAYEKHSWQNASKKAFPGIGACPKSFAILAMATSLLDAPAAREVSQELHPLSACPWLECGYW